MNYENSKHSYFLHKRFLKCLSKWYLALDQSYDLIVELLYLNKLLCKSFTQSESF